MAVTGGFGGRQPDRGAPQDRVPPGQYVTRDFAVLTAGPTQRTRLENWSLELHGDVDPLARWNCWRLQCNSADVDAENPLPGARCRTGTASVFLADR